VVFIKLHGSRSLPEHGNVIGKPETLAECVDGSAPDIFEALDPSLHSSRSWPLTAAIAVLLVALGAALWVSLRQNGGHLVYALDDPYIHMAMAKNVALHGVWSINANHFTSSSSSLLWTAGVAALFFVLGVHQVIPLVLNVLIAIALLAFIFRLLAGAGIARLPGYLFLVLTATALVAPLPGLVFVGQEHILHALVNLAFVTIAGSRLATDVRGWRDRSFVTLCALAFLLPLIRYEAVFVVGIVAITLLAQRKWEGALLIICASVPVVMYGALSTWWGWYWLPNSVLLKGTRPDLTTVQGLAQTLGYVSYSRLIDLPAVAFLLYVAVAAFALRLTRGVRDDLQWMLGIFVVLTLVHLQFAQPSAFWFFRYEAYLIILGSVVVARALGEWLLTLRVGEWSRMHALGFELALVLLFGFSPLPERAAKALIYLPQATTNIYQQQYQMGLFLKRFYDGTPVALNDIGAASYLADIEGIDLAGLANVDVARHMLAGLYDYEEIEEIAQTSGAPIAIVYDSWFGDRIPANWRRAGTWTIRNNVVVGSDTVTFYAIRPDAFAGLKTRLHDFSADLPREVVQRLE